MKPRQLALFPEASAGPTLREVANAVREAGIAGLPSAERRADQARYQEVSVRSALTETKGMPFRWALNPYRGCTHACEYCYARKYQPHLELGTGDDFSSFILVKRDLPAVLRRELAKASWQREGVAVGTATDPYQPIEGHYRITRECLEILTEASTPFSIITKGPMIVRDVDILSRASKAAGCHVHMSVPSANERAWASLEPGTAPPAQRLRAVRVLSDAGIDASVFMMPLVPGITASRALIEETIRAIKSAGVRLGGANVTHLDPGVREHFFSFLRREFPDLLDGYQRLYRGKYAAKDYVQRVKHLVEETRTKVFASRDRH